MSCMFYHNKKNHRKIKGNHWKHKIYDFQTKGKQGGIKLSLQNKGKREKVQ